MRQLKIQDKTLIDIELGKLLRDTSSLSLKLLQQCRKQFYLLLDADLLITRNDGRDLQR